MNRSTGPHEGSITSKVLKFIRENPGKNGGEIRDALSEYTMDQIGTAMTHLRKRKNLIENRGGQGFTGRWYPVEETAIEIPYLEDAQRIMEEMMTVPLGHRARYLAEQIQALTGMPRMF